MENNEVINSCLMLAVNMSTPVDLGCIFDSGDLKDTGIELDSHITLLYAQEKLLPRQNLLKDIEEILKSNYEKFINLCKGEESWNILDLFDLGSFENDSDYVVLKLKEGEIFDLLSLINSELRTKYGVSSDFKNYTPHLTLAELQPGKAGKYLESDTLKTLLLDTFINFEDVMISYGGNNEIDRKQYFLTQFSCIDRYFRILNLKKFNKELD